VLTRCQLPDSLLNNELEISFYSYLAIILDVRLIIFVNAHTINVFIYLNLIFKCMNFLTSKTSCLSELCFFIEPIYNIFIIFFAF